jgi:hypothetical protein
VKRACSRRGRILEHRRVGGGHAGRSHHILGEGLRRLDARGACRRTEAGDASLRHAIGEALGERRFRADDDQVGTFRQGGRGERVGARALRRHAARLARDARISRDRHQLRLGAPQRAHQGVLARPRTDHHHLGRHRPLS